MIRINLLRAERKVAKRKLGLQVGHKLIIACSLILVLALAFIGWRYWSLARESSLLDANISAAQQETARLHSVIEQVQQFEQRRAQLQQRVLLIEQLRRGQTGPVHMLDQISRALPTMLWLTELKQSEKMADEVQIDGRCTTLTGLSDFVSNLEASGYFKRSIEIVSTQSEALSQPPGELIRFSLRAQFQAPDGKTSSAPKTPAAPAKTGG